MKRFIIFYVCVMLFSDLFAQSYELSGKVIDVNKQPLHGARMKLFGTNRTISTDSSGNFKFARLPAKSYTILITKEGYQDFSRSIVLKDERSFTTVVLHEKSHRLQEVMVTDSYIRTRQQQESLNIEVVNGRFIQRNLGGSLMSTLSRLPGVKTIGIGSGQSKPLIRGLGFNRVVVVDKGVKHEGQQWGADHGLEIDQFAAGEVELLKGGASFIYGSDAIAGVINVKPATVPAAHTLGGTVDLIGKTNNNLYGTSINLYRRKQHLFFDSRLTYQNYGDYAVPADTVYVYDFAVPLHQNRLRNTAGRETGLHLSTGYLSDHFRSIFHVSNTYSNSGFFANAHGLEPRQVNSELHDRSSRDILMPRQQVNHFKVINKSVYHTGVHQIEGELGYQRNFRQEFSQYVNHGYMPPIYPDTMTIPADLEREFDKKVYSANIRDQITMGKHSLMIGLNSEHQQNAVSGWTFLVPAFKQTTLGAFMYDKFSLTDHIILHGAIRYDYGKMQMFKYTDWFPSEVSGGGETLFQKAVRAEDLKRSFHSLVWSLGMNYNPEKLRLKVNVGKSFRMPIAKELGANGVNYHYFSFELGDPNLSAEQSYQLDASIGWTNDKWSATISPFYNYFPNYIYLNPTSRHDTNYGAGNQVFQYSQSRVVRYGGEIQLKYKLMKALDAEILGEYLYAEQLSGDKKGYTLPFSPPGSMLLNLTWSPTISKHVTGSYLSVDYRLTASQDNIVPPEKKTAGYSVVNLQAGTQLKLYGQPLIISLQAQNLLNTAYLNHTSFYRLIELPEAGRNVVLSLKVPFQITKEYKENSN